VTYPNTAVVDFINKYFVPLQVNLQSDSNLPARHRVFWTPTIVILDADGIEYYRFYGFLPPDEFIPQLQFGLARMALEKLNFRQASIELKGIVGKHPKSDIAPEAQYWLAVSEYKSTHNVDILLGAWRKLKKDYPDSIWAKKVSFVKD